MFLLAVGFEDGKVVLINSGTENAEELFSTKISDFGAPITSMHWQNFPIKTGTEPQQQFLDFTKHIKSISSLDPAKMKPDVMQRLHILSQEYN